MRKSDRSGLFELCTKLCTLSTIKIEKRKNLKIEKNKRLFCAVVPKKKIVNWKTLKNNYQKILIVMRKIQKTLLQKRCYDIIR